MDNILVQILTRDFNMIGIDKILFSRLSAMKKAELVKNLSNDELLSISAETITRVVKEVGEKYHKSRDKFLCIGSNVGNNWNSEFVKVSIHKGKLYVSLYLQYENTDTETDESFATFFAKREYLGSIQRSDKYGNPRSYYFRYYVEQKAECMRAILLTYLRHKYDIEY